MTYFIDASRITKTVWKFNDLLWNGMVIGGNLQEVRLFILTFTHELNFLNQFSSFEPQHKWFEWLFSQIFSHSKNGI